MYNGIGLTTPRGSGTNGYVQKNLAFVTNYKEKVNYKTDEDIKRSDAITFKEPNKEILLHEKKRKVEVKCFELETLMEEQGYTEDEIKSKVSVLRQQLLSQMDEDVTPKRMIDVLAPGRSVELRENPRLIPKGTHEVAAVNLLKNTVLKDALGISDSYEDGSSMKQATLRRKQAEESKALFEAQKKIGMLKSSSESSSSEDEDGKKKKKKKSKSEKKCRKHHKRKHLSSESSAEGEGKRREHRSKKRSSRKAHSKSHSKSRHEKD